MINNADDDAALDLSMNSSDAEGSGDVVSCCTHE